MRITLASNEAKVIKKGIYQMEIRRNHMPKAHIKILPFVIALTYGIAFSALAEAPSAEDTLPIKAKPTEHLCINRQLLKASWNVTFPGSDKLPPFHLSYAPPNKMHMQYLESSLKGKPLAEQQLIKDRMREVANFIVTAAITGCAHPEKAQQDSSRNRRRFPHLSS